jgi:hypothetical protein
MNSQVQTPVDRMPSLVAAAPQAPRDTAYVPSPEFVEHQSDAANKIQKSVGSQYPQPSNPCLAR